MSLLNMLDPESEKKLYLSNEEREAAFEFSQKLLSNALDEFSMITAQATIGKYYSLLGETTLAEAAYLDAIQHIKNVPNDTLLLEAYIDLALIFKLSSNEEKYLFYNGVVANILEEIQDQERLLTLLKTQAHFFRERGQHSAQQHYLKMGSLMPISSMIDRGLFLQMISSSLYETRNYNDAIIMAEQALSIFESEGYFKAWDERLSKLARMYQNNGDLNAVERTLNRRRVFTAPWAEENENRTILSNTLNNEDVQSNVDSFRELGKKSKAEIFSYLLESLQDDDAVIRRHCAWTLGEIGSLTALPTLVTLLDDESDYVREASIWAIGSLGSQVADTPYYKDIQKVLAQSVESDCFWIRWASVITMIHIGKINLNGIVSLLNHEKFSIILAATVVIAYLGTAENIGEGINYINAMLKSLKWSLHVASIEALGNICSEDSPPNLIAALHSENNLVQAAAIRALGKIGGSDAIRSLVQTASLPSNYIYKALLHNAIVNIGSPALPALLKAWENTQDTQFKLFIITVIGEIGDREPVPKLLKAIAKKQSDLTGAEVDGDVYYISLAIIGALGKLGDERAIPLLVHLLQMDSDLGWSCVWALGKIGSHDATPAVLDGLKSNSQKVKEESLIALGHIGDKETIPHLKEFIHDKDPKIRFAANWSLKRLEGISYT